MEPKALQPPWGLLAAPVPASLVRGSAPAAAGALGSGRSSRSDSEPESEEDDDEEDSVSMNSLDLGAVLLGPRARRFSPAVAERGSRRCPALQPPLLPPPTGRALGASPVVLSRKPWLPVGSSAPRQWEPSPAEVLSARRGAFFPAALLGGPLSAAGGDFCRPPLLPGALLAVLGRGPSPTVAVVVTVVVRPSPLRCSAGPVAGVFSPSCRSAFTWP